MASFDDGKDPEALRTIGEVSSALGIKPHVLRYWEDQFPLLKPLKRAGGRRLYRPADIALIERIDALVNREGYTLKGALGALGTRPAGVALARAGRTASEPSTDALLGRLKAIRDELAAALAA